VPRPAPAVLVANPTAQSGKAAAWIARARAALDAAGVAHEFLPTLPDSGTVGEVRRVIEQDGVRLVIAMGGDGTFAEAAKGILASDGAAEVALGMLPMGTANDQGKSFGLRAGLDAIEANVAVIERGAISEMDVGVVQRLDEADRVTHSDLFFDSMSLGLGAAVLAERNRDRERVAVIPLVRSFYRDHLVYAGALLKKLARSAAGRATFELEAEVDGERFHYHSVIDVIVKNTRIYGGEWVLAPDGLADDGLFEMVPVCGLGELTSRAISTLRGSPIGAYELAQVGIRPARPVPGRDFLLTAMQPGAASPPAAQIDGEEFAAGDCFRIQVLPRVLRLIVPR
jgi:diacylglycerol kinase family enzyme